MSAYVGRFAPSPTGPLHAGSLVAALASWLDARAHGGRWLVRIEDVDTPRCVPGAEREILRQLARCGLQPDAAPVRQSARGARYEPRSSSCAPTTRPTPAAAPASDIARALAASGRVPERHQANGLSGPCRDGLHGKPARAWRLRCRQRRAAAGDRLARPPPRRAARRTSTQAVGDFVLRRADGCWAYQLAVVVDDAAQGVTDVVRGEDLADNTPRQILLQRQLGLPTPRYLHTPLVLGADGEKLSKQNGAAPLDLADPLAALQSAARCWGCRRCQRAGPPTGCTKPPRRGAARWHDARLSPSSKERCDAHHPFRPAVRRHRRRQRRNRPRRPAGVGALHRLAARPAAPRPRPQVRFEQGPQRPVRIRPRRRAWSSAAGTKACRA